MTRGGFSEDARQVVHIAMGGFALLLRVIPWWQAVVMAAAALLFNVYLLRRIAGDRLHRPAELAGVPAGLVFYPLSVLVLLLLLPARPDIVAAAWGIMAAGDGLATLVGRHAGGSRIPWNTEKSVAGSAALIVGGGAAGVFLAWWCGPAVVPPPYAWFPFVAPVIAALAAAAVETIPVRLDDNLSVPASAALVLWCLSLVSEDLIATAVVSAGNAAPWAFLLNATVAAAGYRARTVSGSGALGGFAIGVLIFLALGWAGWALLLTAFLLAAITSRIGLKRKTLLGIAEERGGRRGAGNAVANTGVGAAAAFLAAVSYARDPALVAFVAALTAGASDTIASEIGKAWGRHTWLVTTFRTVPPGTSGAMSLEGTAAGLVGASALAAGSVWIGLIPAVMILPVVAGATIGSLVESALGATLEGPGVLNNDMLNFINTAIAALTAVVLGSAAAA
jgi:uncharacterized protein (TIGR00297 family)